MSTSTYRNIPKKKEPVKFAGTPEELLKGVKAVLGSAVYEDGDYHLSERSMSIDLKYSSRKDVENYIEQLKQKFPGLVKVTQRTHVSIHFSEGQRYDKLTGQPSPDRVREQENRGY